MGRSREIKLATCQAVRRQKNPTDIGEAVLQIWYYLGMTVIPRELPIPNIRTNSRYLRELRKTLLLSEVQRSVVYGTLLGDGCLIPTANKMSYRLQIEHSDRQREYVFWKYKILKEFVVTPPKYIASVGSWKFRTISHEAFGSLRKVFYRDAVKILPRDIDFLEDPLTLAVWFMDDGGWHGSGCLINIQNFTDFEAHRLQRFFENRFGITTTLHRNHGRYRLYIPSRYREEWGGIIKDYLREEFRYKISRFRRDLISVGIG